jgi:hypothetical protein
MRVMVMVKANGQSEAGVLPSEEKVAAMHKFNEQLVNAGVMLSMGGLQPTSKAARVKFTGNSASVIDGPFAETKELVAGYWIWKVKDLKDAVEWLKRAPFQDTEVEIRPIFEPEDFAKNFSPELREKGARLREHIAEVATRGTE